MTSIDFYHNAPDKVAIACRLLARLYAQGRRAVVFAPDEVLAGQLDRILWMQPATGFLPHVREESPLAAETPVIITGALQSLPHDEVLLNLSAEPPPGFSRFEQLVEIVGREDADRVPARERYKFYRDRGYTLSAHDSSEL